MKIFILYQTDNWKTKSSRVCFGVYSSEENAIKAYKANDLYSHNSEIDIVECELDKFSEL